MMKLPEDKFDPNGMPHWTRDDNMFARDQGWLLGPGVNGAIELFSIRYGVTSRDVLETTIKPNRNNGGLEAKAYLIIAKQRLIHPYHKFLYEY